MNREERMKEQIKRHGGHLAKIFNVTEDNDKLARRVHRLEVKAHRLSTDYCNGVIDSDKWEIETEKVLDSLDKILKFREQGIPVFVNGDARGYALKIRDGWVREHREFPMYTDWGGYGILAPEFDGN